MIDLQPGAEELFRRALQPCDYCSLRVLRQRSQTLQVRQNVLQPVLTSQDAGGMMTVIRGDGVGHSATPDLSLEGLRRAFEEASGWASCTSGRSVMEMSRLRYSVPQAEYQSPLRQPWDSVSTQDKIDLLRAECGRLRIDPRIADWATSLQYTVTDMLLLTTDGGRVSQRLHHIIPDMSATANQGADTQTRTLGGRGCCRQGGLEVLDDIGFRTLAPQVADEALRLLTAPNCPSGTMHLLLDPDQMALQIHESIGHPLELDRILGDERNYAGTSFVTMDMFGSYRYGSELLDITFDPSLPHQFASYGYDDNGARAEREYIIRRGLLLRPLGGTTSQFRSGLAGVANERASGWNRPPIDRMANLNLEPGQSTLADMIAGCERGVYMKTNRSWSIDDSRNKFQFGCEWAQLIENGQLTRVVKSPNYRGISAVFWRNLELVGNHATFGIHGTPFCGKGEPNQMVGVGHASPACLFKNVDVFGGA